MSAQTQFETTRLRWDGGEVSFIKWTEKSLVFNWGDARETAVQLPRGAVMRLVEKGVLEVEGDTPRWFQEDNVLPYADHDAIDIAPNTPAVRKPEPGNTGMISRLIRKLAGR